MKFNWDKILKDNTAVIIQDKKQANDIFDEANRIGLKFNQTQSYTLGEDIELGYIIDFKLGEEYTLAHAQRKNYTIYNYTDILSDNINPQHYKSKGDKFEVIEIIEEFDLDFCLGNAVKYILRAGKKDKDKYTEDLTKAKWYIERRIKQINEQSD